MLAMNFLDLDQGTISEILLRSDVESYFNLRLTCRYIYEASSYCDKEIRNKYMIKPDITDLFYTSSYYIPGVGQHGIYRIHRSYWVGDETIYNKFYLGNHIACYGEMRMPELNHFKITYSGNSSTYTQTCGERIVAILTYHDAHIYFTTSVRHSLNHHTCDKKTMYSKLGRIKTISHSKKNGFWCEKEWDKSGKYVSHYHENRFWRYRWDDSRPGNRSRFIRIFGITINF
jgi:hypothetical protein